VKELEFVLRLASGLGCSLLIWMAGLRTQPPWSLRAHACSSYAKLL